MRVQFPDLFAQLQRWKAELTHGSVNWLALGRRDDKEPDWDEVLDLVEDERARQDTPAVLQTPFPAVTSKGAARAGAGQFAHPDYFDRYLAQTIPEGDIPDAVIACALAQAAAGDRGELHTLITAEDDEQVTLALSKIRARYADVGESWTRTNAPDGPVTVGLLSAGMSQVDQLEDRMVSWTSALSQTTYWMANVLRLIFDADPDADVDPALATCTQTQRRAHVISAATGTLDNLRSETQQALREALLRESERILPVLLADLRRGDDSDGETGNVFLYGLVEEAGLLPGLQVAVREGLEAGDFTLEDVAARFVSFAYVVGGPARPSSASFSGALFTKVTNVEADSTELDERGEWAETSWFRRRKFATRYVKVSPGRTVLTSRPCG
jgi:hypothetical protein